MKKELTFRQAGAAIALACAVALTACGGSSSSNRGGPSETAVGGTAAKGLVLGGLVEARNLDGELIASTSTSTEDGSYSLDLPASVSGLLRLEVKPQAGAEVICDAPVCVEEGGIPTVEFGDRYPLDFTLSSLVRVDATATSLSAAITPMTTLVDRHFSAQADQSPEALTGSNQYIRGLLGLDRDPSLIAPLDITSPATADADAIRYALINAAFAGLANDAPGGLAGVFDDLAATFATSQVTSAQIMAIQTAVADVASAVDPTQVPGVAIAAAIADSALDNALAACEAGSCGPVAPPADGFADNLAQAKTLASRLRAVATNLMAEFFDESGDTLPEIQTLLDQAGVAVSVLGDVQDFDDGIEALGEAAVILLFHLLTSEDTGPILLSDAAEAFFVFADGDDDMPPASFDAGDYVGSFSSDGDSAILTGAQIRGVAVSMNAAIPANATFGEMLDGFVFSGSASVGESQTVLDNASLKLALTDGTLALDPALLDEEEGIDDLLDGLALAAFQIAGDITTTNSGDTPSSFSGMFILDLVRNDSLAAALDDDPEAEGLSAVALLPALLQVKGMLTAGDAAFDAELKLEFVNAGTLVLPDGLLTDDEGEISESVDEFAQIIFEFKTSAVLAPAFSSAELRVLAERTAFLAGEASITLKVGSDTFELKGSVAGVGDDYDALNDAEPVITLSDTQGAEFEILPLAQPLVARIKKDGTVYGTVREENGVYLILWADNTFETLF
ncbi:MAG: hypothetical protein LAT61_11285 [Alcanivorax sp.]|nr:hypothetical protein [Alcanivorax sp.]